MSDCYQGDGYEFSIRLPDYRRLYVHVTSSALEFLGRDAAGDQLSVLVKCMSLLRARALCMHEQTGAERIVLRPADLEVFSDTRMAGPDNPSTLH
jgi:hypothetical protein